MEEIQGSPDEDDVPADSERPFSFSLRDILSFFIKDFPDRLLLIHVKGRCVVLNNLTEESDVIPDTDLSDIFPGRIVEAFLRHTRAAVKCGSIERYEYHLSNEKSGDQFFGVRFIKFSSSTAIAAIENITEVVAKREGLQAERDFYKDIINNVNVDIAVLDEQNIYRFINKAVIGSRQDREWLIGKTDTDYCRLKGLNPSFITSRQNMYTLMDELQQPVEWIEERPEDNGNKRFFACTLKPFIKQGRNYKVGYGMDITALKVVQDELLRREHLLSFSHQLVKIGYWVYYPSVAKHEWSDGIFDILGIHKNFVTPSFRAYYDFIHPDDRQDVKKYHELLVAENDDNSIEFRIVTPNGSIKYVKEQSSARASGSDRYIFGVIQDISDIKKHIQEREFLIKEIKDKYNDLMQFNYIISHNLRSPVSNILGMSYLFAMDLSDEEKKSIYEYIFQSAQAVDTVIKDLNHILSTRSALSEKKEEFSIREILDSVCYNLQEKIRESNASLTINIQEGADILISIKSYIHSIFYNLISNAIKYRDEGRDLLINVEVRCDPHGYHIMVTDNGIGIDLSLYRDQIFGLYKRFSTNGKEGRGLGLHMTRAQVESLGGSIFIESQVGVGTSFHILL